MRLPRKLVSSSLWGMALRAGGAGLSFAFMKLVTKLCGAEGWGLYSICFTTAILLTAVARLGTDTALLRLAGQALAAGQVGLLRRVLPAALAAVALVSLLLAGTLWALAPYLAEQVFRQHILLYYLRIAALWVLVWPLLSLITEVLRGLGRPGLCMWLQQLWPYLLASAMLALALVDIVPIFSPDGPLLCFWAGLGTGLVWAGVAAWRRIQALRRASAGAPSQMALPRQPAFNLDLLQRTARPILTTMVLLVVLGWADTLILGYYYPIEQVGVYTVALRIANVVLMPMQGLAGMVSGKVAGLHGQGRRRELRLELSRVSRLILLTTLPVFVLLAVASPWIMAFYGPAFRQGWPLLVAIAAGQLFNALCGPSDTLLQLTGQERYFRTLVAIATALNLALNLALIPALGAWGAVMANLVSISFWNIAALIRIRREMGIWMLRG